MKTTRYFLCVFLFVFIRITQLSAQQLEIHQLNVGSGDAAVILTRKPDSVINKIMIIDFGDVFSSDLVGSYVADVLDYKGDIDYAIISHYDKDHYGGYAKFAERYLKVHGKKITHLIIPGGLDSLLQYPQNGLTPGQFDWNPTLPAKTNDTLLNGLQTFLSNITDNNCVASITQLSQIKKINGGIPFDRCDSIPVYMELVAGLQYVKGSKTRILNNNTYNDDCLAWVLHFGQFRFYTGGDLGGNGKNYVDHESPLADYLASGLEYRARSLNESNEGTLTRGHVCVAKINHHGSEESSNKKFLDTLNPSAWLISCGIKFDHPHEAVLQRMKNSKSTTTNYYGIRGFFVTAPKDVMAQKIKQAFSDTTKFFLQYGESKINGNVAIEPKGTYTIIVKPVNRVPVGGSDEDDPMFDNVPITQRSFFTVRYLPDRVYYLYDFDCHEK